MQAAPSLRVEALPAVTVPPSRKTGRSFAIRLQRGVGARPLVGVDDDGLARPSAPRSATISSAKAPRLGGGDRALVAAQREGVLVLAGDAVALGDVLAGLAHRLGRDAELGHPRVDQPPAERRVVHRLLAARQSPLGLGDHPGRPAHRLDPAAEVEVALAELRPRGRRS